MFLVFPRFLTLPRLAHFLTDKIHAKISCWKISYLCLFVCINASFNLMLTSRGLRGVKVFSDLFSKLYVELILIIIVGDSLNSFYTTLFR